jgi:hypothetical protein
LGRPPIEDLLEDANQTLQEVINARRDGELFFYVNDAVIAVPGVQDPHSPACTIVRVRVGSVSPDRHYTGRIVWGEKPSDLPVTPSIHHQQHATLVARSLNERSTLSVQEDQQAARVDSESANCAKCSEKLLLLIGDRWSASHPRRRCGTKREIIARASPGGGPTIATTSATDAPIGPEFERRL